MLTRESIDTFTAHVTARTEKKQLSRNTASQLITILVAYVRDGNRWTIASKSKWLQCCSVRKHLRVAGIIAHDDDMGLSPEVKPRGESYSARKQRIGESVLSDTQYQKLRDTIPHRTRKADLEGLMDLGYYAGMRLSECLRFTPADLGKDGNYHTVTVLGSKNGLRRTTVVPADVAKRLCKVDFTGISDRTVSHRVKMASVRSGITATFHTLRHSFASRMANGNVPLPTVQSMLGHSNLLVTSLYVHADKKIPNQIKDLGY